jgi:hypothetical protein
MTADLLPEEPRGCEPSDLEPSDLEPDEEPSRLSDLEFPELPCTDEDDEPWEAFIPDEDERDPQPGRGDFWIDSCVRRAA